MVEVVTFAGTLTQPANTDRPLCCFAMLLISSSMFTVLPTPAPPNRPTLPPLCERANQVDNLDAGFQQVNGRRQFRRTLAPSGEFRAFLCT